jgi:hypothetical protein
MRSALGPILVSIALVASLGVVHGIYTDRWGPSGQLEQAVSALSRVPSQFGDWKGEDVPHDAEELTRAGIRGGVFRKYTNPLTRESVSFLIVCGRGGPISVHTPDICYGGAGYRQLEQEQIRDVESGDGTSHSFKVTRFVKPGAVVPTQLEIFWSWSRDGLNWQAPENPRLALARSRALYKMYVVREFMPNRGESVPSCESFLRQALPVIRQTLPSS